MNFAVLNVRLCSTTLDCMASLGKIKQNNPVPNTRAKGLHYKTSKDLDRFSKVGIGVWHVNHTACQWEVVISTGY